MKSFEKKSNSKHRTEKPQKKEMETRQSKTQKDEILVLQQKDR